MSYYVALFISVCILLWFVGGDPDRAPGPVRTILLDTL
jgi:hypothetical protein